MLRVDITVRESVVQLSSPGRLDVSGSRETTVANTPFIPIDLTP